jgi:Lrp/AsnC ligand binding domain
VTHFEPTTERKGQSVDAYVLIQTDANHEPLAGALRTIPGVTFAEDLYGAYDAIALARSGSMQDLVDDVLGKIRGLPGVTRALPAPRMSIPSAEVGRGAPGEAA